MATLVCVIIVYLISHFTVMLPITARIELGVFRVHHNNAHESIDHKAVEWPYYFRICAEGSSVSTVCAVPKFDAPPNTVLCPTWVWVGIRECM